MGSQRAVGLQKERRAAAFLKKRGYRILEHGYRSRYGEIDLIAEDGGVLVFVEVKYRRSLACGQPSEAVIREKQRRIARTALCYVQDRRWDGKPLRFDVVEMTTRDGKDAIRHIEHAFFPGIE